MGYGVPSLRPCWAWMVTWQRWGWGRTPENPSSWILGFSEERGASPALL